jgi:hypothetical protein
LVAPLASIASILAHYHRRVSVADRIRHTLDRFAVGRSRSTLLKLVPPGSICAEVGVWKGDFAQRILDTVAPAELHLIDPWQAMDEGAYAGAWYGGRLERGQADMDAVHQSVFDRFARARESGVVHVHRLPSTEAAPLFPDAHFDFVYIDGNHFEEFVSADLAAWSTKVRPGGLIGGDDYGLDGWWDDGVTKAVDAFVRSGAASLVMTDRTQFALRRPAG